MLFSVPLLTFANAAWFCELAFWPEVHAGFHIYVTVTVIIFCSFSTITSDVEELLKVQASWSCYTSTSPLNFFFWKKCRQLL